MISHPNHRVRSSGNNSKKLFLDNHSVGFIIASDFILFSRQGEIVLSTQEQYF